MNVPVAIGLSTIQAAGGGGAAAEIVAHTAKGVGSSGSTDAIDTTGASGILIFVDFYHGYAPTSIFDSKGNTYDEVASGDEGAAMEVKVYYCQAPVVGSGHTFGALSPYLTGLAVVAVSNVSGFDQYHFHSQGSPIPVSSGNITPGVAGCFIGGVCSYNSDLNPGPSVASPLAILDDLPKAASNIWALVTAGAVQGAAAPISADFDWVTGSPSSYPVLAGVVSLLPA